MIGTDMSEPPRLRDNKWLRPWFDLASFILGVTITLVMLLAAFFSVMAIKFGCAR